MKDNAEKDLSEINLRIRGMTCASCELKIEKILKKLNGVIRVNVSYSGSSASVVFEKNRITKEEIIKEIERLDYKVLSSNTLNSKKQSAFELVIIGIIILLVLMALHKTGIFNKLPEINSSASYFILFTIGLLTSIHCVAMCGGINLSQSIKKDADDKKSLFKTLAPGILYNSGRVVSYTIVGGIVGAIGSTLKISLKLQGIVVITAGLFMILMGLNLLLKFNFLRIILPRMPKFIGKFLVHNQEKNKSPFIIGLLNGLMPCGPLQSMQLFALASGSIFSGALSMFIFSIGTVPLMVGLGALGSVLTKKYTSRMIKVSAMLVLFLGMAMIGRGYNLSGINIVPKDFGNSAKNSAIAEIRDNVQYVKTELKSGAYDPIIVQKGIPVKWTISAASDSINGCNSTFNIPAFGKNVKLSPGDNLVEFTPDYAGNVPYSCWMGMISSTIKVVDDIAQVTEKDVKNIQTASNSNPASCCAGGSNSAGAGSCCGGAGAAANNNRYSYSNSLDISKSEIAIARINNGVQEIVMNVKDDGFYPNIIVLQKNIKTKWIIKLDKISDDNYRMILPKYNQGLQFNAGANPIDLVPQFDFGFSNWKGKFHGFIAVVDDINSVNNSDILSRAKSF